MGKRSRNHCCYHKRNDKTQFCESAFIQKGQCTLSQWFSNVYFFSQEKFSLKENVSRNPIYDIQMWGSSGGGIPITPRKPVLSHPSTLLSSPKQSMCREPQGPREHSLRTTVVDQRKGIIIIQEQLNRKWFLKF